MEFRPRMVNGNGQKANPPPYGASAKDSSPSQTQQRHRSPVREQMMMQSNPALNRDVSPQRRAGPSSPRREVLNTAYNQRAKEGFKYWYKTRPAKTRFGKYSCGATDTFLGIAFAPRS